MGTFVAAACAAACEASSTSAATTGRGGDCASCHMPEYQHVADPVHVDVKPTTCAVCHVQEGWRPSALHHDWWALTGGHEKAPCVYCHNGTPAALAQLKGTPKDCVACHRPEYDSSTFPGHHSFPTKCVECHASNAASWRPAKQPPAPPPPAVTVAPLFTGRAGTPLPKGATSPKGAVTTRPGVAPTPVTTTPPRVAPPPTTRPPDVISRPSRRR